MTEQRRLAAIVSADVAGYSRLMGRDESGTLAALKALRQEVLDPAIASHGGRIVKTTGDGLLLEFPSVVNAVRCAVEVQTAMADRARENSGIDLYLPVEYVHGTAVPASLVISARMARAWAPEPVCSLYQDPTRASTRIASSATAENQAMLRCPAGSTMYAASSGPSDDPEFPPT